MTTLLCIVACIFAAVVMALIISFVVCFAIWIYLCIEHSIKIKYVNSLQVSGGMD